MAKLSEAMIRGLRAIADNGGESVPARTVQALNSRWLIMAAPKGYRITQSGAEALAKADHAEREAAYQAERLSRPVPAGAFVEPAAKRAPVLDHEYEDDYEADPAAYERAVEQYAGPSVHLTPAPADTKSEATDAEVLQLLAVLDAGGIVHRALYQEYGVLDAPFTLNLEAVNRAARDAVRFGLARQTFTNHEYVLTVEPIHLDVGGGSTACARYTGERAGGTRLRVTSDPDKVTHERCRPIKAGDVVRFKGAGAATNTYDVTEVDDDGDYARVWWNNPPGDHAGEIVGRWVPVGILERVTT